MSPLQIIFTILSILAVAGLALGAFIREREFQFRKSMKEGTPCRFYINNVRHSGIITEYNKRISAVRDTRDGETYAVNNEEILAP